MTDTRFTLDQRRARHAWEAVERARKNVKTSEYAREAKRLPVRIITAGLGSAAAFLRSKAANNMGDPRFQLLDDLGDWLLNHRGMRAASADGGGNDDVIGLVINGDARLLRRATDEALQYLKWLTRFAEADIAPDESSDP